MEVNMNADVKKENKVLLFVGLGFSIASFIMTLVPLLLFFIPGGANGDSSSPLVVAGIYVNAFAVAASITGVVLTALCHPKSGVARLNLLFAALGFVIGLACFILSLIFGAVVPLHAMG